MPTLLEADTGWHVAATTQSTSTLSGASLRLQPCERKATNGLGWHTAASETVEVQDRPVKGVDATHHSESGWAAPPGPTTSHTTRVREEKLRI